MEKYQQLLQLTEDLSAKNIYDEFQKNLEKLSSPQVRLGVMGQYNTGKTRLVNALAGTDLPVSGIHSEETYAVRYGEGSPKGNVSLAGQKLVLSDSPWLKEKNLELVEINNETVPDETTAFDMFDTLSEFDMCIYLLNAQSALNRTDLFVLDGMRDVGMPVMLVLSRVDLLGVNDRPELYSYLETNLASHGNVTVVRLDTDITAGAPKVREAVNSALARLDVKAVRKNFENLYLTIAIAKLYEKCQTTIDEGRKKQMEIEKNAIDKMLKLDSKTTQWLTVDTGLRQRLLAISEKLRDFLSERKGDMLRRLSHDVDVCGDVKLFWEKDFPFRLEEMLIAEMGTATQMVNQELIKTIQWLQDELMRQFRCKITMTAGIVGERGNIRGAGSDEVKVTDTRKLKIVTRVGTAATVIAAGALLATSGIGGIIMAVSMVSGIGAEFFMRKKTDNSKEEIKRHLPEIIERTNLQLVIDFEAKLQQVTAELLGHLQTLKAEWIETSGKAIEQEKAIAVYNLKIAAAEAAMDRINRISELLIN